jgi:cytochrome b involved in lipid metabolism
MFVMTLIPGSDGTELFEDIGHSTSARELMEKFCIGKLMTESTGVAGQATQVGSQQK